MASIGRITKIPAGTTARRQDGTELKVGDEVAPGEQLAIENPSRDFTIDWSTKPPAPQPARG